VPVGPQYTISGSRVVSGGVISEVVSKAEVTRLMAVVAPAVVDVSEPAVVKLLYVVSVISVVSMLEERLAPAVFSAVSLADSTVVKEPAAAFAEVCVVSEGFSESSVSINAKAEITKIPTSKAISVPFFTFPTSYYNIIL